MKGEEGDACRAWQLLMRFFFTQRGQLPSWGAEFGLSPVQCHVLHLVEPGRPLAMSRLAATLSCDASNVTGLVDRLEARGLLVRRPSPDDRRVKVIDLTPTGSRLRAQSTRRSGIVSSRDPVRFASSCLPGTPVPSSRRCCVAPTNGSARA